MLININKIKELKEKKVVIVDLSEILGKNFDIVLPFKAKGLDEQIRLLSNVKYGKKYTGVKTYMQFRRTPKAFQTFYLEESAKTGSHELQEMERAKTFVLIDTSKDMEAIKERNMLERLMKIVIHIDMDHVVEGVDGEEVKSATMWECFDIKKDNYLELAKTFAGIITNEELIARLEYVVEGIKNNTEDITEYVSTCLKVAQWKKDVEKLSDEEKAELSKNIAKIQKEADENGSK